ncbi:hypothetical protein [Candidatus Poriferisodalis sp.]|uniref:hypothetical protein n=1 Tax=Candidatus Poriferisodalis sp. TaxID=3101277 RepID=UPI003B021E6B
MISGTASVDELAAHVPEIAEFGAEPIQLGGVTGLSLVAELRRPAREAVLPPGLHPIVPPAMSLLAWDIGESPWGPFAAAFVRVVCRSGARARTFCVGAAASTKSAVEGLRAQFGFPARQADVSLRRHYDEVDLRVSAEADDGEGHRGEGGSGGNGSGSGNGPMLAVSALDPDPLSVGDLQHVGSMNLAHTPMGLRLVQIETHHEPSRVERLAARIDAFDAAAWGQPLLDPYWVVSCSVSLEDVEIPAIRFVCDPALPAAEGTERVQ